MRHWIARLVATAAFVAGMSLPALVHASGITFSFQTICTENCELIGLASGDTVFGSVLIAEGAVVGGGLVDFDDILGLDLHLGSLTFALPSLQDFGGTLNASATAFEVYIFFGGVGDGYFVSDFLWAAGADVENLAAGPGGPLVRASIPEPATLALCLLAIAAVLTARRRRSR